MATGLLGKFEDAFKGQSLDNALSSFGNAWDDVYGVGRSIAGGVWNMLQGVGHLDGDLFTTGMRRFFMDPWSGGASAVGHVATGLAQTPFVGGMLQASGLPLNELVKRPIAAAALVAGDAMAPPDPRNTSYDPYAAFKWDTWKKAYNDTEYIPAGQAVNYAETAYTSRANPEMVWQADPRSPEGKQFYQTDVGFSQGGLAKLNSGATDAAIDWFLDPTVYGGKAAKALKVRYISKPMGARAYARDPQMFRSYANSEAADKAYNWVRSDASSPEHVRMTLFNRHTYGDWLSNAWYTAAKIPDPAVSRRVFNNSIEFAGTSPGTPQFDEALKRLAADAPEIADSAGSLYANYTMGDLLRNAADPQAAEIIGARAETKVDALTAAITRQEGMWGQIGGALRGQWQPRLTLTSQWRYNIHQWVNGGPITVFGRPLQLPETLRSFLPTGYSANVLYLDRPDQAQVFRAVLESYKALDPDQIDRHVSQFARATSRQSRYNFAASAEEDALRSIGTKYGFTEDQTNQILNHVRTLRFAAYQNLSNSRRYLSSDVAQAIQRQIDIGDPASAEVAASINDGLKAAIQRGDQPSSVLVRLDEDGNAVIHPEGFDIGEHAFMPEQHAPMLPMMNGPMINSALRHARAGRFLGKAIKPWGSGEFADLGQRTAQHFYDVRDFLGALAESANKVWKVSNLLRPGYALRTVPDDAARALTLTGLSSAWQGSVAGLANAATNLHAKYEAFRQARYQRWLQSTGVADADLEDINKVVDPSQSLASKSALGQHVGFGYYEPYNANGVTTYDSYENAFADGALSLDGLITFVEHHADERPGTLPTALANIVQSHREGFGDPWLAGEIGQMPTGEKAYMRTPGYRADIADYALGVVNRDAYRDRELQNQLLSHLADSSTSDLPASVRIDPFTWLSPEDMPKEGWRYLNPHTLEVGNEAQALENYVRTHVDELLKPRSMLDVELTPQGEYKVYTAKADPSVQVVPKMTGTARWRIPFTDIEGPKVDAGTRDHVFDTPAGPQRLRGAFKGAEGDQLRSFASATTQGQGHYDRLTEHTYRAMKDDLSKGWGDILPTSTHYGPNWERVVNYEFGSNPVARRLLAGDSVEGVIRWMRSPEGRGYVARLGPWQDIYEQHGMAMEQALNMYVPGGGVSPEAKALRKAVLNRTAKYEDAAKVAGGAGNMPMIHGQLLDTTVIHKFYRKFDTAIGKAFRGLSDIPNDMLARFPLLNERYHQYADDMLQMAAMDWRRAGKGEAELPIELRDQIATQAGQRALGDVKRYLYDNAVTYDIARIGRFAVPFGSAAVDAWLKWGRIAQEKPWLPFNMWKIWNAPEHAGLVQDDNGNRVRVIDGKEVWQYYDVPSKQWQNLPDDYKPGDKMVILPLPKALVPRDASGVAFGNTVPKDTMNVLLNWPSAGPMVAVPLNNFALKNPEFADNALVKKFVYPYGPSVNPLKQVLPSTWRTAIDAFNAQDGNTATYQAISIFTTEMTNYRLGLRGDKPTYEEAKDKAQAVKGIRLLYQLGGLSPQFESPYQLYVNYYHNLRAMHDPNDPQSVDEKFYNDVGDEYYALTASVNRNRAGIPASLTSWKNYQQYKGLTDQHPEIMGWIVGRDGAGEFSRAVYESELAAALAPGSDQKMREPWSLEDSIKDVEIRKGWIEYGKLMDSITAEMNARGLHSLSQKGASDLQEQRQQWIDQHTWWDQSPTGGREVSPWFDDFNQRDDAKTLKTLNGMMDVLAKAPPEFLQRDDNRGLIDYLLARQDMQALMDAHGYKTLNSQEASALKDQWDYQVHNMVTNNLAFAQLYNYWLTGDQYLTTRVKLPSEQR